MAAWSLVVGWVHRPTPERLLHTVPDNPGDPSFVMWTMRALGRALLTHPGRPFDGNTFFPHDRTLLFSDLLAGLAVPYGLLIAVGAGAVLALNLLHLGLGLVSLEVTFRLVRRLGVRAVVAGAAAVAFAFSTFTLAHVGHVNLQAVFVLPAGALLLLRLLERPSVARGAALGAFAGAAYLTVGYFALMLAIEVVVLAVAWLATERPAAARLRSLVGPVAAAGVVAAVVAGPIVVTFLDTRSDQRFERRVEEVRQGELDPDDDLLEGAAGSVVFGALGRTADEDPEHGLAPDLAMVLGLAAGAVALLLGRRRDGGDERPLGAAAFLVVGVSGYLLALGPQPGMGGLAFRAAGAVVPGFDTVRVPARLALLLLFGVVVAGALGWERLLRVVGPGRPRFVTVIGLGLACLTLAQALTDVRRWPYDDRPSSVAVYADLQARPPGLTVVLPMRDVLTTSGTLIEATRMVYSTIDWNPRVNGYSSFVPGDYEARRAVLTTFPSDRSLELLDELGVRYVVLERGERSTLPVYRRGEVDEVLAALPPDAIATAHGEAHLVALRPGGRWADR